MECDICGTPYKVYYPEFREVEPQCDCELFEEEDEGYFKPDFESLLAILEKEIERKKDKD